MVDNDDKDEFGLTPGDYCALAFAKGYAAEVTAAYQRSLRQTQGTQTDNEPGNSQECQTDVAGAFVWESAVATAKKTAAVRKRAASRDSSTSGRPPTTEEITQRHPTAPARPITPAAGKVKIISALPLTSAQKAEIAKRLPKTKGA